MVPHMVVLVAGVAIGLSIFAIAHFVFSEPERTPNRPYSQRRNPPERSTYPSSPTNTEPRYRANRPETADRATSPTGPELANRATSPINSARHFADECLICGRSVVAFQPCGDYLYCRECAENYYEDNKDCPMCNRRIQSID